MKPFIGTLRVTNPVRQSRASSRKRVLRGGGRPSLRSVDSEIKRCVIEPRNFLVVSPRLGQSRGPCRGISDIGPTSVPGHTGVGGTWRMIKRVPRELGRPCSSLKLRPENRYSKLRDDPRLCVCGRRGRKRTHPRYRQAKETKCGEKDGRESERPIVPLSQGNHPRDPGEGRGRRLMNRWRET